MKYEEEELPEEGWLSADKDADLATRGNGSTEDTSCRRCDTGTAVTQRRLNAYLLFPAATHMVLDRVRNSLPRFLISP